MVPSGWKASQIGDIAKFSSGGTPSKQNAEYWGGTEPWISGKDLKTHYLSNSIDTLTEEGFKVAKKAPKGSSLILVRGMTLLKDFPVGYATKDVAFNQDLKALVPARNVDGLFLSFLLVAEKHKIRQLVSTAGHGTGRLDTLSIREYPINLPPHPEQTKIAQILSTWDKATTTTEQLLANSQQQKKALMQQLLTGKKRLLDENGVRFSGEWLTDSLKNIVGKIYGGGTPSRDNPDYWSGSIPWVTVKDLIGSRITGAQELITDQGLKESSANLVAAGTVIIATRMAVGKTVVASCEVAINQDLKAISASEKACSEYLFYWFTFHSLIISKMGTGSTVKGVQIEVIKSLKMSVPDSIDEQQKIAAVLSTADQETTALQQKLNALKQEKKALMQQLLTGKRRVIN
jgi:type I restriction enzyme S subunit